MNNIDINVENITPIEMTIEEHQEITLGVENATVSANYPGLTNKPQINNVTLLGNKTSEELYLQHQMDEITPQEIDKIIYGE